MDTVVRVEGGGGGGESETRMTASDLKQDPKKSGLAFHLIFYCLIVA